MSQLFSGKDMSSTFLAVLWMGVWFCGVPSTFLVFLWLGGLRRRFINDGDFGEG